MKFLSYLIIIVSYRYLFIITKYSIHLLFSASVVNMPYDDTQRNHNECLLHHCVNNGTIIRTSDILRIYAHVQYVRGEEKETRDNNNNRTAIKRSFAFPFGGDSVPSGLG